MRYKKYCFTLDLKDDPGLIEAYEQHHRNVWPEVLDSIKQAGIVDMEIYKVSTRLFMIMKVDEGFSFEKKLQIDKGNPKVLEWEELMERFQSRLPFAENDEKWVPMKQIFSL